MKEDEISRGEFLKLSGCTLVTPFLPKIIDENPNTVTQKEKRYENINSNNIVAKRAAIFAKEYFEEKPYKFGTRDCAIFVALFSTYFGIPITRDTASPTEYRPEPTSIMPHATTVKQVAWFKTIDRNLGGGFIKEPESKEISKEEYWSSINSGSLVYLKTEGESQHGYDQYSHVVAFLGFNEDKKPIFGEYAVGMKKGPEIERSLKQVLKMYYGEMPKSLKPTIIDLPKLAGEIWKNKLGPVRPNSDILLKEGFTRFLTVNLNNGLTTNWAIDRKGDLKQKKFSNGVEEIYSVIGRKLITRINLTKKYDIFINKISKYEKYAHLKNSSYSGENAIFWGTPICVPRYTLTPPLIFELSCFSLIGDFGNPIGFTDTALIKVLVENNGSIEKVGTNSNYTIHAIPQKTNSRQNLLLRDRFLNKAKNERRPVHKDSVNLTSGCVNYTPEIFDVIKNTYKDKSYRTAVIFSYPQFPQNLQLNNEGFTLSTDPLGEAMASLWGYTET